MTEFDQEMAAIHDAALHYTGPLVTPGPKPYRECSLIDNPPRVVGHAANVGRLGPVGPCPECAEPVTLTTMLVYAPDGTPHDCG